MRKITLLCNIVDNLGDAGVSLRFARQWITRFDRDEVAIWTDDIQPFLWLVGGESRGAGFLDADALSLYEGRLQIHEKVHPDKATDWGDVVIEAFGSPVPGEWKRLLSQRTPQPAWINLEYLSAENWVEDFHGKSSIDPATGWKQLFFFPGFTEKTGGLLGHEPNSQRENAAQMAVGSNKIFVFCYENAPVMALLKQASEMQLGTELAAKLLKDEWLALGAEKFEFVAQTDFDAALLGFRWLFVRGEDSFVRAQLAGLPLVWQIYPTEDGAHWPKLTAFFEKYTESLGQEAKRALWNLWCFWNGGHISEEESGTVLRDAIHFEAELLENASRWRQAMLTRCHLIEHLEAFLPPRC